MNILRQPNSAPESRQMMGGKRVYSLPCRGGKATKPKGPSFSAKVRTMGHEQQTMKEKRTKITAQRESNRSVKKLITGMVTMRHFKAHRRIQPA